LQAQRKSRLKMDKSTVAITIKDPEEAKDSNAQRINIDPKNVEKGLAKLVLTIVELLRQLMEKQVIRRVEADSLTEEEVERVGEALMKIEDKMKELKKIFGIKDEELNINLGPLGDLM